MKFVNIESAKGLEIDVPVYTLNAAGQYGYGKLVKSELTKSGTVHTFETAIFIPEDKPPLKPVLVTDITYVAIIKEKTEPKEKKMPKEKPAVEQK